MRAMNGAALLGVQAFSEDQRLSPDSQVVARPSRRTFTDAYKIRVLQDLDSLATGEKGAYLRREGLYSSHIVKWRRQLKLKTIQSESPKAQPVAKAAAARIAQLERENARLEERLRQAELIVDVQKKVLSLCESTLATDTRSSAL